MYWAPTASWVIGGTYCFICMMIAYRKKLLPLAVKESGEELSCKTAEESDGAASEENGAQDNKSANDSETLWEYSDLKEDGDDKD